MRLATHVLGVEFQNPVLLAAGTCGFGMELVDVLDLEALGGVRDEVDHTRTPDGQPGAPGCGVRRRNDELGWIGESRA